MSKPSPTSSNFSASESKYEMRGPNLKPPFVHRGDEICRKDDYVDFFGIICYGSAFISFNYANMKNLPIGSMIGQMNAADFSTRQKHLATIKAGTDGMIAVLPFGELKSEVRKSPKEVCTQGVDAPFDSDYFLLITFIITHDALFVVWSDFQNNADSYA